MQIIGKRLTIEEFNVYVSKKDFGSDPADKLVIHHTWKPTKQSWDGIDTLKALKKYYELKNWYAGPHLFVAEDGIWLFSDMRKDGIHTKGANHKSIGIEVVGNYDDKKWSGETYNNAVATIKLLMERLNIPYKRVYFHRDFCKK